MQNYLEAAEAFLTSLTHIPIEYLLILVVLAAFALAFYAIHTATKGR
jgi:hypothetical protein